MTLLPGNIKADPFTRKSILLPVLILLLPFLSYGQDSPGLNNSFETSYGEELYVTTDREVYFTGENVFLKIFKLNRLTHTPSDVSKVVYIELLDSYSNPAVQIKAAVENISGTGEFRIPDTLRTGNYLIRSGTLWMQNFSPDFFSYKQISVINPFENLSRISLPDPFQQPYSVMFFPESGNLVSGTETVTGLRSYDTKGDPVSINGYIVNEKNDTLSKVNTDENGYGKFTVKPEGNSKLHLATYDNNRKQLMFPLPEVQDSGIAFKVGPASNGLIKLKISMAGAYASGSDKYQLVYSPVSMSAFRQEIHPAKEIEIPLRQGNLPAGLAKISITNSKGDILAMRWIYNDIIREIFYNISAGDKEYASREKVTINITATDGEGNPVESNFSVSVVKSFSVEENTAGHPLRVTQLARLAGMKPVAAFTDINDYLIFVNDLDDPSNNAAVSESFPEYYPEPEGHLISGFIRNTTSGDPLREETIVLSYVGKTARSSFTRSDENGNFNFVTMGKGKKEIVIQPLSPELGNYYVELTNPFPEVLKKYKPEAFHIDSSRLEEINKAIISMQVGSIYKPFLNPASKGPDVPYEPDFFGQPDLTINMSDYIELTSFREVIKEIVPGVSTYKRNDRSNFRLINKYPNYGFETNPMIIVDGIPVSDLDKVLAINSGDLEKIDILNTRYFVSDLMIEGIIDLTSKKGDLGVMEFTRPVFRQEFEALQNEAGFFSPDYSDETMKNNRIPDFRNTLYWNPLLKTDKQGQAGVEFFTSDETGAFTIIVEGISPDGNPGRSSSTFRVIRK